MLPELPPMTVHYTGHWSRDTDGSHVIQNRESSRKSKVSTMDEETCQLGLRVSSIQKFPAQMLHFSNSKVATMNIEIKCSRLAKVSTTNNS